MHFIWDRLQREIKTGEGSRRFRRIYIDFTDPAYGTFSRIVVNSYKITRNFYRDCNKMPGISKDGIAVDESVFYNKPNLWKNFMSYSKKHRRSDLVELDKQFKKLIKELKKYN